ncbi:hypothetical protein C0J52_02547 [Blattella germanica]|nr:hypothetical protein C0J52_02547 [Blattella germanica]
MPIFIVGGGGALLLIADTSSGGGELYSDWPADWSVCATLPFEFLYGMVLFCGPIGTPPLKMVAAVATKTYGHGYFNPGPRPESPVMTIIQDTSHENLHTFISHNKKITSMGSG